MVEDERNRRKEGGKKRRKKMTSLNFLYGKMIVIIEHPVSTTGGMRCAKNITSLMHTSFSKVKLSSLYLYHNSAQSPFCPFTLHRGT